MIKPRKVWLYGQPTSVSLEDQFWETLKEIALRRKMTLGALVAEVKERRPPNLSSALRVYALTYQDNTVTTPRLTA